MTTQDTTARDDAPEVESSNARDVETLNRRWMLPTLIEMLVCGAIGLTASFVLSIEAWEGTSNEAASFACDINASFSCSAVARSWQATLLGFPNAFFGILFEAVVLTVTVALLLGARMPRSFMLLINVFYTVAIIFALWLFSQSFFVIHALCPWCLTITVTTTLVFAGLTRINIRTGALPSSDGLWDFVSTGRDWWVWGGLLVLLALAVTFKYLV
ncbi:vitamin K epoxide reductase family protein [Actinomyces radicidentis]|nr:vitamin K epoxide reductase family protein [Actinomyces radicidentis]